MDQAIYSRRLPHIHPVGETLFVTFRTADSLPKEVLQKLREDKEQELSKFQRQQFISPEEQKQHRHNLEKRAFARFDAALDKSTPTANRIDRPAIAAILTEALHWHHRHQNYQLLYFCIMPNHVHLVVTLLNPKEPFQRIIKSIKAFSSARINQLLNRTGPFWQREYYDHVVRNGQELKRVMAYVLENPVKAGLCATWQEWPYTYLAEEV